MSRSIFRDIDAKLKAYRHELVETKAAVSHLGGAYVRALETGFWTCTYRPTHGERHRVRLRARSSAELIAVLEAVPDRPHRKDRPGAEAEPKAVGT